YGLAFAALQPERLRSLSIFNTTFFPDYRWHFWGRVWRTPVLGELAMRISNRPLFVREAMRGGLPRAYADEAYDNFSAETKRMVLRWYRAMDYPVVMRGWDERLLKATARTPKQVIWGDKDPFMPASTADRFDAPVQHFPDCGHWVMAEKPEEAAKLVAALVERAP